jgi:hypothetical protein
MPNRVTTAKPHPGEAGRDERELEPGRCPPRLPMPSHATGMQMAPQPQQKAGTGHRHLVPIVMCHSPPLQVGPLQPAPPGWCPQCSHCNPSYAPVQGPSGQPAPDLHSPTLPSRELAAPAPAWFTEFQSCPPILSPAQSQCPLQCCNRVASVVSPASIDQGAPSSRASTGATPPHADGVTHM